MGKNPQKQFPGWEWLTLGQRQYVRRWTCWLQPELPFLDMAV